VPQTNWGPDTGQYLKVEILDQNGNVLGIATHPIRVDPTGTTVQPVQIVTSVAQNPAAPTAATVGVTSAQAVAINSTRTGIILVNTSANWISLGLGAAAVLYSGITLAPNGGAYEMDAWSFTTDAINAIASGATSNLAIQEYN
jgi:hypothetical protein